jgi:hypothetical protein
LQYRAATLISKCRDIVTYIHKSPQALEKLFQFEQEKTMPKLGVIQDVETRWSSTFLMLQRLLKIKGPLCRTLRFMTKHALILTEVEWSEVNDLVTCLEPFALITVSYTINIKLLTPSRS